MQLDSGIEIGGTSAQPVLNIMNAARERNDRIAAIKRAEDERNRQEFLGILSQAQHNVQGRYWDGYLERRKSVIDDVAKYYASAQQNGGRISVEDQIKINTRLNDLASYAANANQATKSEAEWIMKLATLDPNKYDLNKTKENLQTISNITDPYVQNQMFANPDGILVRRPYKIDYGKVMGAIKGAVKEVDAERGEKYNVEKARELAGGMWDNDPRAQESVDREKYIDNTISLLPNGKPPYNKKSGSSGKKLKEIGSPITGEDGIEYRPLPDRISGVPVTDKFYYMKGGKLVSQSINEDEAGTADFVGISTIDGEKYAKLLIGTEAENSFLMNFGGSESTDAKLSKKPIYVPLVKYMDILGSDYNTSSLDSKGSPVKKENKYGI